MPFFQADRTPAGPDALQQSLDQFAIFLGSPAILAHPILIEETASQSPEPRGIVTLAELAELRATRAKCRNLGPVCQSGCAGDVHECIAGQSSWPGQPNKAGEAECFECIKDGRNDVVT